MDPEGFASLFDLSGRVAVVTGASRGIGRSIAEGLVCAGARVVVSSRKADACVETAAALAELGLAAHDHSPAGGWALPVAAHMGELDAIDSLVATTVAHYGRLDIVVNNAANGMTQPMKALTVDGWDKSFNANLRGPAFLAKAAYPHLVASPHAAILNLISVGAITWSPGQSMYSAAKAGLLAFTRNLAAEWAADNIRVNALAPGTVDTDMLRSGGPGTLERVAQISQMKRVAHVDEMVGPALLLVSDASSYMTGQMIVADGGYAVAR